MVVRRERTHTLPDLLDGADHAFVVRPDDGEVSDAEGEGQVMCRNRLSLFQAKQIAQRCANLIWHEQQLSESDIAQLVHALEDMISDRERRMRRRWIKRWNRRFGVEMGND